MQFDDQRIKLIAQSICSKTNVPEITFDMPCVPKRKVINKISLLVAIIFTVICLLGAVTITYYFSGDNQAFKTIQDRGFVSVVNKKIKNDDVTLTVQAIVTDGLKSYVRIKIDGVDFIGALSGVSSFFVAVLTALYVYTTSKQIDVANKQLMEMKEVRVTNEQPLIMLKIDRFEIFKFTKATF